MGARIHQRLLNPRISKVHETASYQVPVENIAEPFFVTSMNCAPILELCPGRDSLQLSALVLVFLACESFCGSQTRVWVIDDRRLPLKEPTASSGSW